MKNEFLQYADNINKMGSASLVGVLTHKHGGIDVQAQIEGDSYDVVWLAAVAIYRIHKIANIPLDELGKQLNGAVDAIREQDKE